jgi:hypothetical protein
MITRIASHGDHPLPPRRALARNVFAHMLVVSFVMVGCAPAKAPPAPTTRPPVPTPATRLYLSPPSLALKPEAEFDLQLRVDIRSGPANAVAALLHYSKTTLTLVSTAINSSVWGVTARSTGGDGVIKIEVGTTGRVGADSLVASLRFKVAGRGNATISFDAGSAVVTASDASNQLVATSGFSTTIT